MKYSVDKFIERHTKKQKYLFWRIVTTFLLVVFGFDIIFTTKDISAVVFSNSLLLFFLPLFIEYLYGMDAYGTIRNCVRWVGLLISGILVLSCFIILMGKGVLEYCNQNNVFQEVILLNKVVVNVFIIKAVLYFQIFISGIDYLFSFSKKEMEFSLQIKQLEKLLDTSIEKRKVYSPLELKTLFYKQSYSPQRIVKEDV